MLACMRFVIGWACRGFGGGWRWVRLLGRSVRVLVGWGVVVSVMVGVGQMGMGGRGEKRMMARVVQCKSPAED